MVENHHVWPLILNFSELSPEEQAKRDKRLLKKEELSREHDKILAEIENHDKNSVNLALKKLVSPQPGTHRLTGGRWIPVSNLTQILPEIQCICIGSRVPFREKIGETDSDSWTWNWTNVWIPLYEFCRSYKWIEWNRRWCNKTCQKSRLDQSRFARAWWQDIR